MPREEIESMKEKVSREITSLQVLDDLDRMQTENGYTYNQTAKKYIANLFTKIFSTFKKSPSPTALIAASSVNEPILASNESNNKNDFREILSNDGKYVESTNEYLINLQRQGRKSQQLNKCKFESLNIPLYLENLETLILVTCYDINMKYFKELKNLKNLKIIRSSIKSYKNFGELQSLEKVYLQNFDKVNLKSLLKINTLKYLNLDGSTVKNQKYENILKERIKLEHSKEFIVL